MIEFNKLNPLNYFKGGNLSKCCKATIAALVTAMSLNGCGFSDESKLVSSNDGNQANTTLVSQNIPSDFSTAASFQDYCYSAGN